jgi:hypothetical protein
MHTDTIPHPAPACNPGPDDRVLAGRRAVAVQALAAAGVVDAERWVHHAIDASTRAGDADHDRRPRPAVRTMADIAPETVRWVWDGRIPIGGLTALIGDPGEGKSTVSLAITTAVTLGVPLPGETGRRDPADVLLLSAEDSPSHTIRPRLEAMGADLRRVHILDGVRRPDGQIVPIHLADPGHRAQLREAMEAIRPRMVIIDPVTAYLADTDTHRDADVRTVLAPLADLAAEYDCAIVYVMHLRKGSADRAIYRAGGSIAFIGAARSALLVGRDPDDPSRRAVAHIKSNLSPLAPTVGFDIVGGRFWWVGEVDLTADRMLAPAAGEEERTALAEAVEWLREYLAEGPRPAPEVYRDGRRAGHAERTIRRAAAAAKIKKNREGFGRGSVVTWSLPHTGQTGVASMDGPDRGQYGYDTVPQWFTADGGSHTGQTYLLASMGQGPGVDDDLCISEDV